MEMEPNHQMHTHDEPSGVISCPDLQSTQAFDMDEDESVFRLTYEDRLAFLQALLNPPPPNARLRAAVQEYMQQFGAK